MNPHVSNHEIINWAMAFDVYGVLAEQPSFEGLPPAAQDKIVSIERKDRVDLIRTAISCAYIEQADQITNPVEKIHHLAAAGALTETIEPITILYNWKPTTSPSHKTKLRDFRNLQDRIEDTMPHLSERDKTRLLGYFWPNHEWQAGKREPIARIDEHGITFNRPVNLEALTSIKGISAEFATHILEFLAVITTTETH